jgi:hypothetical protein
MSNATAISTDTVTTALRRLNDIAAQIKQVEAAEAQLKTSHHQESLRLGDRKMNLMIEAYEAHMDRDETTEVDAVERDYREWCLTNIGLRGSSTDDYVNYSKLVLDQFQEFAPTSGSMDKSSLSKNKLREISRLKVGKTIPKKTLNEFVKWCADEHGNALPATDAIRQWIDQKIGPAKPAAHKSSFTGLPPTMELRLVHKPALRSGALLGLGFGSADDVIKLVCRHLRQQYHPDKGGDPAIYERIDQAIEEYTR